MLCQFLFLCKIFDNFHILKACLARNVVDLHCVTNAQDHNAHGPDLDKPPFHPQNHVFPLIFTEKWYLCPLRVNEKWLLYPICVTEKWLLCPVRVTKKWLPSSIQIIETQSLIKVSCNRR